MIQNNGNNNQQLDCFHFFISLLFIVPIILDQDVGCCSYYFESECWLLFPLFWIRLLADKKMETVANSLIQNNGNSNQHSDPKR
jgi:hypothetical protein